MQFRDYFSGHAEDYAIYRPDYPAQLFAYLAELAPDHKLAWDCATGNGQAAVALADYFEQIIATDASERQIQSAIPKSNVIYRVMPAEQTDFADNSISLITVATALHWFDFDKFYAEAKRILKPNGIIAAWSYSMHYIDPVTDEVTAKYSQWLVTDIQQDERADYFMDEYKTIPFPFPKIQTPIFRIEKNWNFQQLMGYLSTWSRLKNYIKQKGKNPLEEFMPEFFKAWGEPSEPKLVYWPVHLLVGRKENV